MEDITVNQWVVAFESGTILDVWYDWFCRDTSLENRARKMGTKIKRIAKSTKINCDASKLMFKNNCPMFGRLYDDFRILTMNGDVIYTIVPKSGHRNGMSEVWGENERGEFDLLVEGTWRDVCKFFGV